MSSLCHTRNLLQNQGQTSYKAVNRGSNDLRLAVDHDQNTRSISYSLVWWLVVLHTVLWHILDRMEMSNIEKGWRYIVKGLISISYSMYHYLPWYRIHTRAISSTLGKYSAHVIQVCRQLDPLTKYSLMLDGRRPHGIRSLPFFTRPEVETEHQIFWSQVQWPIY